MYMSRNTSYTVAARKGRRRVKPTAVAYHVYFTDVGETEYVGEMRVAPGVASCLPAFNEMIRDHLRRSGRRAILSLQSPMFVPTADGTMTVVYTRH